MTGLVTGIAASLYYYQRAEDELRHLVESRLAEIYPGLTIRVGSARIVQGEGIRLGQISVVCPESHVNASPQRSQMAYIEMLTLQCDASLAALLQRKLILRHIICDGLTIYANVIRAGAGIWEN